MKIKVSVKTKYVGSLSEGEFEIEDDCNEKEIEEFSREAMFGMIDWWLDVIEN